MAKTQTPPTDAVPDEGFTHTTVVDAPAAAVWAVLADLPGWDDWNPVYGKARGDLTPGSPLRLTVKLPGMTAQKMKARVVAAKPGERLVFEAAVLSGLLTARRSFELVPLSRSACTLQGREAFGGLLGPLMARLMGKRVQEAVGLVNEALKQTAEAGAAPRAKARRARRG